MPELPETETMARDLHREIAGRTIERVAVRRPDVLREVNAKELARRTRCVTIVRSWRRAKLVVLDLSSTDRIVVQPRFTGALLLDRGALDESERRFSTLEFALGDSLTLHYRDIRRLGTVSLMSPERWASYVKLERELRSIEARSNKRVQRELKSRWRARAREVRRARRYGWKQ